MYYPHKEQPITIMEDEYNPHRTAMIRAWKLRKFMAAFEGCKVTDILMGECLRLVWIEIKDYFY